MNANTKIIALACSALLALTGTASAHHGANNSKVYAGKIAGTTAATDPATAIGGRALLVDGASKNLLAVKVRNLKPNTAYTFALDGVSDIAATTATTDEKGKLEGFVKSDAFNAADGATYTVVVKEGDVTVASSTLAAVQRKGFGHRHKHKHGHHKHGGFAKQGRSAQDGAAGHDCNKDASKAETAKA
ncbi:MAG: hypothetical protein ACXWZZ_06530 [Solirubrobacteraceae bacterium]